MAAPNPTSQTLVNNAQLAATLQYREKGYEDMISKRIPLFWWLKKKGKFVPQNGGDRIEFNLEYGLDTSEASYGGWDLMPINEQDNVTTAYASWKNLRKSIAISGEDRRKNSGYKVFDLLQQKEQNALKSLQQQMNSMFYGDGTSNSGKHLTGLKAIISETPTSGTLFGINRATSSWWQNQSVDSNAAYWDKTNSIPTMSNDMLSLRIACSRLAGGSGKERVPDLGLCSETYYQYYDRLCTKLSTARFVNTNAADAGFSNLTYMDMTLMYDNDCPADAGGDAKCFFINSAGLKLIYHPQANFKVTDLESKFADGVDGFIAWVLFMGELVCTNPAIQGVHQGVKDVT